MNGTILLSYLIPIRFLSYQYLNRVTSGRTYSTRKTFFLKRLNRFWGIFDDTIEKSRHLHNNYANLPYYTRNLYIRSILRFCIYVHLYGSILLHNLFCSSESPDINRAIEGHFRIWYIFSGCNGLIFFLHFVRYTENCDLRENFHDNWIHLNSYFASYRPKLTVKTLTRVAIEAGFEKEFKTDNDFQNTKQSFWCRGFQYIRSPKT